MAYRHATWLAAAAICGIATAASSATIDLGSQPAPVPAATSDSVTLAPVVTEQRPALEALRPSRVLPRQMSTLDYFAVSKASLEQTGPHALGTALLAAPGWRAGTKMRILASPALGDGALVLGFGAGPDRRRALGAANSLWRTGNGGTRRIEFGWMSGDGWRLTGGYTAATGGLHKSGSRLLDLAHGAHPRENGAHMTLAFADASRTVSYGLTGGSGTLTKGDALNLGHGSDRHDANASLFWMARF